MSRSSLANRRPHLPAESDAAVPRASGEHPIARRAQRHGLLRVTSRRAFRAITDDALVTPLPIDRDGPRRLLNIAVAAIGLILTSPIFVVIAVLVKLTSRGPIFFTQTRLGVNQRRPPSPDDTGRRRFNYGGRPFTIYKFRTMTVAPKGGEQQVWARPDDARVTPIGRVLRKYRLDELPQLFNALLGDMNVVGPRPEQPAIAVRLRREIRGYHRRQRVAPGITGLAQISRGYDRSLEDVRLKLVYDLQYIRRRSVWEDLRIMLRTLPVMLLGRGGW